jgi:hypothetical protein
MTTVQDRDALLQVLPQALANSMLNQFDYHENCEGCGDGVDYYIQRLPPVINFIVKRWQFASCRGDGTAQVGGQETDVFHTSLALQANQNSQGCPNYNNVLSGLVGSIPIVGSFLAGIESYFCGALGNMRRGDNVGTGIGTSDSLINFSNSGPDCVTHQEYAANVMSYNLTNLCFKN